MDNEVPFTDRETGDKVYLKDFEDLSQHGNVPYDKYQYEYCFFDMDEDGAPELVIRNPVDGSIQYIFRYDAEKAEHYLWYRADTGSLLYGSRKIAWDWNGGNIISFAKIDADGDAELNVGMHSWKNDEHIHMVMLPDYREEEKKIKLTDSMKQQGIYESSTGRLFFRVTYEQCEELMEPFWEARDLAEKGMEVTYSYEELFAEKGEGAENAGAQYEHWIDFSDKWNLPYASQQTFEAVKGFYAEIDFLGEFQKGDTETYGEYKEAFLKLLQNEMPFRNRETGENVYLKDFGSFKDNCAPREFEYYFFDMNEDDFPELTIRNNQDAYIFQYDAEANEHILWYAMESGWYGLIGSRKVNWTGLGKYLAFYLLDQEGGVECETFFIENWYSSEVSLYVVMVPQYKEAGRITVTEEMKAEGIYERCSGQWFFRVTKEQLDELADIYWEAEEMSRERIKDVTYTYEELFGSLMSDEKGEVFPAAG